MSRILRSGQMLTAVDLPTVRKFYDAHGLECAWSSTNAGQLLDMVKASADHGLSPDLFHPDMMEWPGMSASIDAATQRDILLTDAALKYASVISNGFSGDGERNLDDAADHGPNRDFIDGLMDSLYSDSVRDWLTSLAPQYPAYVQLQSALARYRDIADRGGWNQLPNSLVKASRRFRGFGTLRTRLAIEGDLLQDSGSERFDSELSDALARFQARNGLRSDGILTAKTLDRLNVSAGERIASISLNLERLRVSLRDMPATRVEVNLPAATLLLYREGEPTLAMNVVVGAPKHETPELSSVIDTVVLNPSWTIPRSIIENEIKPLLGRDRKYLKKNRMYWVKDQLVQEPGPGNALGRIKFDFPNSYSVYLHDTPSRKLFTDPERAASHGCVRLERPMDLAVELLQGGRDWNRRTLQQIIDEGNTQRVSLEYPMPVVITYQTAFADKDGTAHFRPDIYGRDTQLTLKLASRVEMLKSEPLQW
ncbi:MAG: L,D-transpeptidase family protein [Micropepsaceae bacterium]